MHWGLIDMNYIRDSLAVILGARPNRPSKEEQSAEVQAIYQDNRVVSDRTIDSHIKKLRKKISEKTGQELIFSVYGVGYKYENVGS